MRETRAVPKQVMIDGIHAPAPRLTVTGAALLAAIIAVPAGGIISLIAWALGY